MVEWITWLKGIPFLQWIHQWVTAKKTNRQKSDTETFKRIDAIANETQIDDILNQAIYCSHFYLGQKKILIDLMDAHSCIQNTYFDSHIKKAAEEFCKELGSLLVIVNSTYWQVPGGWLKFRPDPIDRMVYDTEWKEVDQKIEQTWTAYRNYRMMVKHTLLL